MKTKFIFFSMYITLLLSGGNIHAQSDGALDTSFIIGSGFGTDINESVYTIAIQPNGKILVGGSFTTYNGTNLNRIARLNADGSLDNTFIVGTGFSDNVNAIILQPDGKILVGGSFQEYVNGQFRWGIARLNADGSQDLSFGAGSRYFSGVVKTIALQTDGKILVGGNISQLVGGSIEDILRLNTNGTIDNSFVPGAVGFNGNGWVNAIILQPDGKIIVGGNMTHFNGSLVSKVVRLNTNGSMDYTFFTPGGFNGEVKALALQQNGKIIAGGPFIGSSSGSDHIVRFNSDGSLDPFVVGASFSGSSVDVRTVAVQPDGKILVGGQFEYFKLINIGKNIARLNTDGTLDSSFVTGTGFHTSGYGGLAANTIALQNDNKILVGGGFLHYNGVSRNKIARLHIGTLSVSDVSKKEFVLYPNPVTNTINFAIAVQSAEIYTLDGRKIIIKVHGKTADLSKLEKGTYIIKGMSKDGHSFSEKVIKN